MSTKNSRTSCLLLGARLLVSDAPRSDAVLIEGQRIVALGAEAKRRAKRTSARSIDLDGLYLAPGFIDLHTHGAVGVDFVQADEDEFARAMKHYLAHGVTSLLVSLYPTSWKESLRVLGRVAGYLERGIGGGVAIGIHLEGPFLNPGRPGALPPSSFRPCSTRDAAALLEAGGGWIKTVTVAPELKGADALIRTFQKQGVVPAFGHSLADYEMTRQAVASGIRYATHLFNAMSGLHHREPGAVTALLEEPEVAVEVISDGEHISVPVLRLIHAIKDPEKIILVSDSVHPCGLADGRYEFAGAPIRMRKGKIQLDDGTIAGSALTLGRALAIQVREVGVPMEDVAVSLSASAARAVGLTRSRGRIAVRRRADLVAFDETCRIQATWHAGELKYSGRGRRFV